MVSAGGVGEEEEESAVVVVVVTHGGRGGEAAAAMVRAKTIVGSTGRQRCRWLATGHASKSC